jgi:broad specificity phosphatase PhoE
MPATEASGALNAPPAGDRAPNPLILVRHSLSQPDTALPAARWRLSEEGRRRCRTLAEELRRHGVTRLIGSPEPKARETAELAGAYLGVGTSVAAGLEEHHRATAAWLSQTEFEEQVARLMNSPNALVFGGESAAAALDRFRRAVDQALSGAASETVALVTHGTVLTLFIGAFNPIDPLSFWKGLGLPAVVVVERPSFRLIEAKTIV